ncbi:MAG: hypothetical protein KAR21_11730 [Spirochaetales bacterium]|nr:hypothetical protein [Spirochaetales bacterium]
MDNELELEGLLFEEEENQNIFLEQEPSEQKSSLSDRWASWLNIVNR